MVLFGMTLMETICATLLLNVAAFCVLCAVLWSLLCRILRGKKGKARERLSKRLYCVWGVTLTIAASVLFVAVPIWMMVHHHAEIMQVKIPASRIAIHVVIAFPAVASLVFILFGGKIGELLGRTPIRGCPYSTEAKSSEFRSVNDFRSELIRRGLYFDDDAKELLEQLNGRFAADKSGDLAAYYYSEATIMPLEKKTFEDSPFRNKIISPDSDERHAAYVYNAVLIVTEAASQMRYAPIARYSMHTVPEGRSGDWPHTEDCYVECKILYIDGQLSAIIGVGESEALAEPAESVLKPYWRVVSEETHPREERGWLTTFFDGKYYLFGTVRDTETGFEQMPDTREHRLLLPGTEKNYRIDPGRVLDRDALDQIAELSVRQRCCKDAIAKHFAETGR